MPSLLLFPQAAFAEPARRYLIERQKLERAIQQLALQSGRQVVFVPSAATNRMSKGVSGHMRVTEALDHLLAGTGLVYRESQTGVILIEAALPRSQPDTLSAASSPQSALGQPLIVTARQVTNPVSFSTDILLRPRPGSIEGIVQATMGMSSQPSGAGQQGIMVRGVGLAGDTTTIVYFGDVPISGPSGTGSDGARTTSDLALLDIARIQSSRTSRGTEHGVGALAGEIEIEPEAPRLGRWEGYSTLSASVQQGGEPGFLLASTLNVPLGDDAAIRLTGYIEANGGYVDNVRSGQADVNDDDIEGLRFMARYNPMPEVDFDAMLLWQNRRINDPNAWLRALGPYKTDRYFNASTTHDFKLARLKASYATGPVRITSITAFYRWKLDRDYDRTNVTLLQAGDPAGCQRYFSIDGRYCTAGELDAFASYVEGFTPSLLHIPIISQRAMQEVRIEQEKAGGFNWVVGLLMDRRTEDSRSELSSLPVDMEDEPAYFGVRELKISRTQKSVFADVAWKASPGFIASAGVRYDHYTVSTQNDVVVPNIISGSISSWPAMVERSDGLHTRFHADVPVTSYLTLHAQLNRSFRPAGVNTASVLVPNHYTYEADSLWGYELGFKLQIAKSAQFTATSYFNDWQDMQYRALSENRSHAYLVNVGNASIKGVEAELILTPLPGVTAKLQGSFIKGRLTRTADASELVGGAEVGDQIPFVPDRRLGASLQREWHLANDQVVALEADWLHQTGFWSTFSRSDQDFLETGGFHVFNAEARYEKKRTSLSFGAKNIFNRVANLRAVTTGYGVGQTFSIGPRELSLTWTRRW